MTRTRKILTIAAAFYVAVFAAASFWKYANFLYTGIDLAYFNQTFWNTAQGRWFQQSIHPHLSLGDHAELIVPLLAQIYRLWTDPRMLLLLQTIALALPIWPLCLIAKRRCAGSGVWAMLGPTLIGLAWLLNPIVQNINLYEFHILPFALLPLFFALLEYDKGRKTPFLIFAVLSLLVREDVALVVAMIGVLAWVERKSWWWALTPFLLGIGWLVAATRLIAEFAPGEKYKFLAYYSWLGGSFFDIAANSLGNLFDVLAHVATLPNLEMIVGAAMPLLFLPFFRPRRLILAVGPLLLIVLQVQGGGALILQTHYATLFLPGLFLAAIEALSAMPRFTAWLDQHRLAIGPGLIAGTFLLAAVYGSLTLGPLSAVAVALLDPAGLHYERTEGEAMLRRIPADASVAASYRLLPRLSSRERLYSLHYQFLGVTQFGERPYAIPDDVRFVAADRRDLLTYRAQYEGIAWAEPRLPGGPERLRAVRGAPVYVIGPYVLYDRAAADALVPLLGARFEPDLGTAVLRTSIALPEDAPPDAVVRAAIVGDGLRLERLFPIEDARLELGEPLYGLAPGLNTLEITLERQRATFLLNGLRSPERVILERETIAGLPAFEFIIP